MLIDKNKIEEILPHGKSIIMIDNLFSTVQDKVRSTYTIQPGSPFVSKNKLSAEGMIENMAQTAIMLSTHFNSSANQKPKKAFLGAISKLNVAALASEGDTIETEITHKAHIENLFLVEGKIYKKTLLIAQCELKIALSS